MKRILIAPFATAWALPFLFGTLSFGQSIGLVGGIARDAASGRPLADAQISAHNLDKGTDDATVTGSDGIFTFTHLDPGAYEVAAVKKGFRKSSVRVEVAASRTAGVELPLQLAPEGTAPAADREAQLLERIERLEKRLAAVEGNGAAPKASEVAAASPPPTASPAPAVPTVPMAAALVPAAAPAPPAVDLQTPFADYDWTWLNGNSRQHD